jgi:phosphoglycolate phosphatase-like HAD superfamily hydrolase
MIVGFDLDGVIAKDNGGWTSDYYSSCKPDDEIVCLMKVISKQGHKIIIYTARLSNEVKAVTVDWLNRYGVPYDAIHFDKPLYDFMLDDRGITVDQLKSIASQGVE